MIRTSKFYIHFFLQDFAVIVWFDLFRDNAMNINEFTALIKALFRNEKGKPYPIDTHMITEIFNIFNKSGVKLSYYFFAFVCKKKVSPRDS